MSSGASRDDQYAVQTSITDYPDGNLLSKNSVDISSPIDNLLPYPVMRGNFLNNKIAQLNNLSNEIYFANASFEILNFTIYENNASGPFSVMAYLEANYTLNSSIAYWKINRSYTVPVTLQGLPDPYLGVMTKGIRTNNISWMPANQSTIVLTYQIIWQFVNFTQFLKYKAYKPEPDGPSYLMRLSNNTSFSRCCGIESLIFFEDYPINMTQIDYCYWSGTCLGSIPGQASSLYNISNISKVSAVPFSKFLLDPYHVSTYNLTESAKFFTNESQFPP